MTASTRVQPSFDLEREVHRLVTQMTARFGDISSGDIERVVRADFARLSGARVHNFVPVLVERAVAVKLRSLRPSA